MLAVLLLALAGLLLLRHQRGGERPADPSSAPEAAAVLETAAPTATPAPEPSTEPLAVLPTPTAPPAANAAESPAPAPGTPAPESQGYTEYTYGLVSDMVYTYRHLQSAGMETVRSDLEKLKEADPALGGAWERIMDCWVYVNTELEVNTEEIPAELPTDDSLVIVVLGFQLLPDGAMDPELIRRCELGLACAQQYPEAFVLVTGGGTALGNKEITEGPWPTGSWPGAWTRRG